MSSPPQASVTDPLEHNRRAWNRQSLSGTSPWCEPVGPDTIDAARRGDWSVILTPNLPVPRHWFGGRSGERPGSSLEGLRVLCLASGGGQQAPILAAAGALVTSFDNSDEQLAKDAAVARRDGLALETARGDMAHLERFADASFDLIFHPVSNVFAADPRPVWRECHRILAEGGRLLAGFMNPDFFMFDHHAIEAGGPLEVRFTLPYADLEHLPPERLARQIEAGEALEFSHSLDAQIGAQIESGFVICGFYEDRWNDAASPLNRYMPTSMATLALKTVAGGV